MILFDYFDDKLVLLQLCCVCQCNWLFLLVWFIFIVVVIVGLIFVVKILVECGLVVIVSFCFVEGLEVGKIKVKYKDVEIGQVQSLKLVVDCLYVLVGIQLNQDVFGFNVEDICFWVVCLCIVVFGILGLGILFFGVYIGVDVGVLEEIKKNFVGLEQFFIVMCDVLGCQFVLYIDDFGLFDIGFFIFYCCIKVGQVVVYDFDSDGCGVMLCIFVNVFYDKFVIQVLCFWYVSGFDMEFNVSGFKLYMQVLLMVVLGGIVFCDCDEECVSFLVKEGSEYLLVEDESIVMKELDGVLQIVLLYFDQLLCGL